MQLNAKIPEGPLAEKWLNYKAHCKLVNPKNKKKLNIIVIGTGLAGASAAASFGELGYKVQVFCFQDSARRAHSVAAQGGVNAAKNYSNDGDTIYRMFYDTLKGGDFRSREANVYRLAELSTNLIDQAVAQGVPFGREYSGYLANRSFGGVQVSRTFYARGQTGQQLLLGAYQALAHQQKAGNVQLHTRHEMLDLVTIEGQAKGVIVRDLVSGKIHRFAADAVVLATGGYSKIFYLSTLAMGCNGSAIWRAHKKGALFAAPSWTQIHPTSLPQSGPHQSKLTLMSESLRNDGRIWVPLKEGENRAPHEVPENERDYYLERRYPSFGNLAPRDISSRAAKERIDAGFGVGPLKNAVYLDFKDAIRDHGEDVIRERYGNLFRMYENITGRNAYQEPMLISPAAHFSMGGLWVDYELMTTIPGLYAIGECNFSDHGANRLGANSLLQACVDGYFIIPMTIGNYLADKLADSRPNTDHPAFAEAESGVRQQLDKLLAIDGKHTVDYFHKAIGKILWQDCAISRNQSGLEQARLAVENLRTRFWKEVKIPGKADAVNSELEKAGRVADYLEMASLMIQDALQRNESCGAHFREEYQSPEGEALRNDDEFCYVSAWEFAGLGQKANLHKEHLNFETVALSERSYK